MENSELVKNFERIRDYMRQFYVYGFKSRTEYDQKSARSYDNERRRIESWLGNYMSFRREGTGKQVFFSMDSRVLSHNPLYDAFKAKSFTDKDITFHFYILDLLCDGSEKTVTQMLEEMDDRYLRYFPDAEILDISILRKKLKEYETLGLVRSRKQGKELLYSKAEDSVDLNSWMDALDYFSEASPVGVIGSFLLDRLPKHNSKFRFKHHYLVHTLDSQILYQLLDAVSQNRNVILTTYAGFAEKKQTVCIYPYRIYISAQTGRQYLLGYCHQNYHFRFLRMDTIHAVKIVQEEPMRDQLQQQAEVFCENLWGVSVRYRKSPEHIEMTIHAEPWESYILDRLHREKRNGYVEILDANTYRFRADVYDAREMLPWIRTFIGRIEKLECSNPDVTKRFYEDIQQMYAIYGGGGNAVS